MSAGRPGRRTPPIRASSKNQTRPDAIKDFVGAIVRSPVAGGEPIRDSKVVIAKNGGFMAAILPRGMHAISLDVAPDTGAGGFILPNDHVDWC
jgi:pilus assembly protein CpaB